MTAVDVSCGTGAGPKKRRARRPAGTYTLVRGGFGSELVVLRPVGFDLLHQRVGQRHVVQRARLLVAVRVGPAEELQRLHDERDIQSARFLVSEPITGDQARAIIKMLKGDQQ